MGGPETGNLSLGTDLDDHMEKYLYIYKYFRDQEEEVKFLKAKPVLSVSYKFFSGPREPPRQELGPDGIGPDRARFIQI